MKTTLIAGLAALAALASAPALAQAPAAATTAAAATLSVETTPIGQIIANPEAKAVLEREIPMIDQYYAQIAEMTLAQVAPMSQGALDDAKLKVIQAEFDKLSK